MLEHVVVVGAGLGGLRTVEQLRRVGYTGRISLVGAEEHLPYDRPPLSKQVLTGEWEPEQTQLRAADSLAELDVTLRLGVAAVGLRPGEVTLADGEVLRGDALVVATGLDARRLPGQPAHVLTLRSLEDALTLRDALAKAGSLLVVGGGFIGAEVASSAVTRGVAVTVLEALPVPSERALGPVVGALCGRLLIDAGVDLRVGVSLSGFVAPDPPAVRPDRDGSGSAQPDVDATRSAQPDDNGSSSALSDEDATNSAQPGDDATKPAGVVQPSDDVTGPGVIAQLGDGTRVEADVAVVGIGAVARLEWLAGSGIDVSDGVVPCDATGRVHGAAGVWAVGDVAAWDDPEYGDRHRSEHWTSAVDQAAAVARDIVGAPRPTAAAVPYFWSDQFGLKIQLFGRPDRADGLVELHGSGLAGGEVRGTVVGYTLGDRIVAVVGFGAPRLVVRYRPLVARGSSRTEALATADTLR